MAAQSSIPNPFGYMFFPLTKEETIKGGACFGLNYAIKNKARWVNINPAAYELQTYDRGFTHIFYDNKVYDLFCDFVMIEEKTRLFVGKFYDSEIHEIKELEKDRFQRTDKNGNPITITNHGDYKERKTFDEKWVMGVTHPEKPKPETPDKPDQKYDADFEYNSVVELVGTKDLPNKTVTRDKRSGAIAYRDGKYTHNTTYESGDLCIYSNSSNFNLPKNAKVVRAVYDASLEGKELSEAVWKSRCTGCEEKSFNYIAPCDNNYHEMTVDFDVTKLTQSTINIITGVYNITVLHGDPEFKIALDLVKIIIFCS